MSQVRFENKARHRSVMREILEDHPPAPRNMVAESQPWLKKGNLAPPSSESKVQQRATSPSITYGKWYWEDEGTMCPYEDSMSENIEIAYQNNAKEIRVDSERFIDLKNNVQRRYDNRSRTRKVKRMEEKTDLMWYWREDNGEWRPYGISLSRRIEEQYLRKEKILKIDDERYIDAENFLQRRHGTENAHEIKYVRRRGPPSVCFFYLPFLKNAVFF